MKYNLAKPSEAGKALDYLLELQKKGALAEVKKISPIRTSSQNRYLHLILGAFAQHFGYTLAEAKLIYKELNGNIYAYKKKDRTFYRSSADLTKEEMMKSIDRFREASAVQDYPLPLATDQEWLMAIENAIEQSRHYL